MANSLWMINPTNKKSSRHQKRRAKRRAARKSLTSAANTVALSRKTKTRSVTVAKPSRKFFKKRSQSHGGTIKSGLPDIMTGGVMAGGALLVDVIFGMLPLPTNLKTGMAGAAVKALVGVGAGIGIDKLTKKRVGGKSVGSAVAAGAVVIGLYNVGRTTLAQVAPQLGLGEFALSDYDNLSEYDDMGSLAYGDMGYINSAPSLSDTDSEMGELVSNY